MKPLAVFVEKMRKIWGAPDWIGASQALLEEFARSPDAQVLLSFPGEENAYRELYRDSDHGFLILAHAESEGEYRSPHDHGDGWVVYAVLSGCMEMRTYGPVKDPTGSSMLVRRESYRLEAGEARLYLPGDIHDTQCLSQRLVMLRLTSCDLQIEKREGRMRQYPAVLRAARIVNKN